jgi:peptidoglycan biosynthesis protein MviN/MurJ (putative lipid II flippase)
MPYLIKFILVILAMIIADVCWTYYFIKVEERKAIASGIWSALIIVASSFITTSYVEDKSLVPAAVIGAFIGTAGTVWYKKKKENK